MPKYGFPFYKGREFNATLTDKEILDLKRTFPNLGREVTKLGPPTYGMSIIKTPTEITTEGQNYQKEEYLESLCEEYGCDTQEGYYIKDFHNTSLKQVDKQTCEILNSYKMQELKCITLSSTSLTYNCLGWNFGVRDWVNPMELHVTLSEMQSKVKSYIEYYNNMYNSTHEKNVLNILSSMTNATIQCGIKPLEYVNFVHNNEALFYFLQEGNRFEMTHGARYVTYLNNEEQSKINSLTSKLGEGPLISHDLDDLNSPIYGHPFCLIHYYNDTDLLANSTEL